MPISFTKKEKPSSIWVKNDPSKPFEQCTDITQLPKEVLDALEKEGYDEEDVTKVYKITVGDYTYQFKFWRDEWQCSRWPARKAGSGGSGGGFSKSAGPREWSYTKMVDFEIGNLNDLHDIMQNQPLESDETWDLLPFIVMNSKDEPHGVLKKYKRVAMLGSEEKSQGSQEEAAS